MIVYEATKGEFLSDSNDRDIADVVLGRFTARTGHRVPDNQIRAWANSLGYMARVLNDDQIPADAGVAIEYHIPQTAKRLDFLVSGYGENGSKNAVIVELKQWEAVETTEKDAIVITFVGGANREEVHPCYQAWSYAELLKAFNQAVYDGGIGVWPCAYLHNYPRDGRIDASHYATYLERAPVFLKGEAERSALRQFIGRRIRRGDRGRVIEEIESGPILPSKALADSVASMLAGNPEFVLIDDQKAVFEAARAAALAATDACPRVVIVEGGPGTGKSVVAINLLANLLSAKPRRLHGRYVSKNAAPRKVFEARLTGSMRATHFRSLFAGSGAFVHAGRNAYDFLVVDETHRLNEKSGLYGNQGDHQIREIINAARCSVFFIDEDQRVTLRDIGTREQLLAFSQERGARVDEYRLQSQFRCAGSEGYLAWLDDVLDIRRTANTRLDPGPVEFRVFDDPGDLHAAIEARNGDNRARVVAGYCWRWNSRRSPDAWDIEIGSYRRRWNLDRDGSLWIIAPESVSEVGCIHTCQGLEVNYVGVIIGPDLVMSGDRVTTVPQMRARQDQTIRGWKTAMREDPAGTLEATDRIIKNTYRTLMTRGMKGCYIYCTDAALRQHFRRALAP